jgi:gliding motility-associated-like protein
MKNLCFKIIIGLTSLLLFSNKSFAQPTATVSTTGTTCGQNDGQATVTPAGGTGSYTFHWYPSGLTTNQILNQPCGPGVVNVFDGVDSILVPYNIACSTAPSVTIAAVRDTFCFANGDTLTATANGATPGYVWSGGTLVGTSNSNPLIVGTNSSGSYTYTVVSTDGAGCTATASYTLVALDVSAVINTVTQPSCGINNGSIQMSIQSGPRYVAKFSQVGSGLIQSGNSLVINNLLPGTYSFTIDDLATGCSATVNNIVLTDNTTHPTFDSVVNKPETCFGDRNGSLLAYVGNCSGCVYAWSNDATNHTDSAIGLTAGTYTLSVSSGGCTNITNTYTVTGPSSALVLDTLRVHQDHCDHHVGSAVAAVHGGTPPYSYAWSQGVPFVSANDSVTHLYGDSTISVTVTDSHGCSVTKSDTVTTTPGPSARILHDDTICGSEHNGVLIVEPTSNDGPFTYRWTSGSTTTVAGGLAPGAYYVTVTNAVGCDTVLMESVQAYSAYAFLNPLPTNTVYLGQTVTLLVSTNVPVKDVHWLPYVDGSTGSLEAYDKPTQNTKYTVTVVFGQACELHDTVDVYVLADTAKMVVPNTFTPNGDGVNDNFYLISYPPSISSFHIWIFDRWGAKVYESTDVNFNWDGTDIFVANKPLTTAVFAYAIEYRVFNDPEKRDIGGNISLVK